MKRVALAALLCGAAHASPATLADQLALKTRGVRVECAAQCLTLPVPLELARLTVDVALGDALLSPWRAAPGEVVAEVRDGTGRATVTLRQLSEYSTRVEVAGPAAPGPTSQRVEYAGDLRMMFGMTRTGPLLVRYQGRAAPLTLEGARAYLDLDLLRRWGCAVTPRPPALVRVACPYPNIGTLYADVPPLP